MKASILSTVLLSALGVVSAASPDELKIKVITPVECHRKTRAGDYISVHYEGKLEDGTVFDSSYNRGVALPFNLGQGQVIKCWDEGLLDMCKGEVRELWCHPNVAYGERGIGPIPPNSALIFKAELFDIAGVDVSEETQPEKDEL
ncbi:uncharacterized protein SPAPADRAFT_61550 [Spathaspora passalidarum NRRL Y-27907]|uniref:peptidylprolyl isomerase n=1 Tax=Spathaspora passalidarum (strain NRRL Y-27907 / 11-Y1) TaxID=619300 RepID=G3AN99_SPAPN|nr:uncharacterized protein SPAPADRAFT_61550 [Spathaspora passalidarum NRRL Y-27907]EGW32482.1 hypothetical protein SPAPADRAFT_61550 [Spathaspora passalidarum NRRL Y-27907]